MSLALSATAIVTLTSGDDGTGVDMSFGDFLCANVDSIDDDTAGLIALTLAEGFTYRDDDGVEPRWTVKLALPF